MKYKIKYLLLMIIAFSITTNIKAQEIESCEFSDAYIKWSNMSKEEQEKYIKPAVCKHKKSTINTSNTRKFSILKDSSLPATYNARATGKVTAIRNQGNVGSCWAFSALSMTESYVLNNFSKTYQFSSRHMDYASSKYFLNGQTNPNGFNRYAGTGGNSYMAANYMVNHYGPILESYMPFVNSTPQIALSEISGYPIQADVNGVSFGTVYGDTTSCNDDSINDMKNLIYNVGPITVSIYMGEDPSFFNSSTKALYNEVSGSGSNHSVLAIGWDDNYSVDNFVSTNKPSKPGAWIIQNSWGSYWGDGGLFYISYEDTTVCTEYSSIRSVDLNVEDHIYSHDELGYDSSVNLGLNAEGKKQGYTMNIFSKDSTNEEYIKEVTFAMASPGSYRVYAYKGNLITDSKNINNMQLIGSGTSSYEGYTTLKLDTPYKLDIGVSDFSVAVYYLANNVDDWVVGVSAYTSGVAIETGKSYASSNGLVWQDLAIANGKDNKSREASIKVSTDDAAESLSTLFKVTNKEIKYETPLKAVFSLNTLGISGLDVSIKDSTDATIVPSEVNYEYLNGDYTKVIISFESVLENGDYTFTFTYNTNLTNEQTLNVNVSAITNIAFKDTKLTIQANSCIALPEIVFTPNTNVIKNIEWSTTNSNITIYNNQLCTGAYASNDDVLTATSVNGISKSIFVDIIYDYLTINNYPNKIELDVGEELLIDDRNYDDRIFSRTVCWDRNNLDDCVIYWDEMTITSSDSTVISDVGNRKFKALKPGEANILITSKNGKSSTISVVSQISYTGISLNKETLSLNVGESEKLVATATPANATLSDIFDWNSTDESVATVNSDGIVTAIGPGSAIIRVLTINGFYDTVRITVSAPIVSIEFNHNNINMIRGEKFSLTTLYTPSNTTDLKAIVWTSSNDDIASVNADGLVTTKAVGNVVITATSSNGKTATCNVNVTPNIINIDSITLNTSTLNIEMYKSYTLTAMVNPNNTTLSKVISWTSSNNDIVSVDSNGNISANKIGSAIITATSSNGKTATCNVLVTKVNVNSVSISKISNKTYTGKQIKPSITITYGNKTLKYKTDYTIKYGTNKYSGKGSVKITLIGSNYTGTKTVYFGIVPKKVSIKTPKSYSKGTAIIYYYKTSSTSAYQIAYRVYGTTEWKYINTKSTSKKIFKLKRKKTYQVMVRAYKIYNNQKYYGAWSSKKTVKIK